MGFFFKLGYSWGLMITNIILRSTYSTYPILYLYQESMTIIFGIAPASTVITQRAQYPLVEGYSLNHEGPTFTRPQQITKRFSQVRTILDSA